MRNILALAAAGGTLAAGNLYAVSSIHNYGITKLTHNSQTAHIGYQCVVAEACTALGKHNVMIACFLNLFDNIFHVPRCQELAFFYINSLAGFGSCINQIGLAAQEGRDLQNIYNLSSLISLPGLVDIGYYRNAQILFNLSQKL